MFDAGGLPKRRTSRRPADEKVTVSLGSASPVASGEVSGLPGSSPPVFTKRSRPKSICWTRAGSAAWLVGPAILQYSPTESVVRSKARAALLRSTSIFVTRSAVSSESTRLSSSFIGVVAGGLEKK